MIIMVRRCSICKTYQGAENDVSFHRLPRYEETRAKWLALTVDYTTSSNCTLCSKHFQESDFIYKIYGTSVKRYLKAGTCPSILPSQESADTTNTDENSNININTDPIVISQNEAHVTNNNDTIIDTETTNVQLKRKTSEVENNKKRKCTARYVGDLSREDFTSNESWKIFRNYVAKSKNKSKLSDQKVKRLNKRLRNLQDMMDHLKKKRASL